MLIRWSQALAWRMRRHLLEPIGTNSIVGVVERLGGIPAMDLGLAELAVRVRRTGSAPGEVARAHAEGQIIKSYAFRGATHFLSPADGGAYLALRASGRQWELPSWQEYYRLRPTDWPAFREGVREALRDGPLSVEELGAAVTRKTAYRHLRPVFDAGAGALIKALTWQGDMSFGPSRDGQRMFQRLDDNPHWAGIWDLDEAGLHAITSYVRTYGPATLDHFHYRFGNGLSVGRKHLASWLTALRDRLTAVDVEGQTAYVLVEDVDDLMAARPTKAVRLLPGHDQWVIGPGTNDKHVVPPARRTSVTRKANLVVAGGVVSGTWSARTDAVTVTWFGEHGTPPRKALEAEVVKLATLLGGSLRPTIEIA